MFSPVDQEKLLGCLLYVKNCLLQTIPIPARMQSLVPLTNALIAGGFSLLPPQAVRPWTTGPAKDY